jgi:hypothetical protein
MSYIILISFEIARIEYLFELHEEYLTPLLGKEKKGRKK